MDFRTTFVVYFICALVLLLQAHCLEVCQSYNIYTIWIIQILGHCLKQLSYLCRRKRRPVVPLLERWEQLSKVIRMQVQVNAEFYLSDPPRLVLKRSFFLVILVKITFLGRKQFKLYYQVRHILFRKQFKMLNYLKYTDTGNM